MIYLVLALLALGLSGSRPVAQESQITFHSSSNLVLVGVIARNAKNGLPDKTLTRDDFEIFDNGRPVSIKTFDNGAQFTTRPLALWFVVQCYMSDVVTEGSGLFRGEISLFEPALKYLDSEDTVAVAHWCDDGESKLDLLPTRNFGHVPTVLEEVLERSIQADDHDRTGELALQKTLQLIVDATQSSHPEPLPVVIFLYGDHSGMPRSEANHFVDELLETSATVYGLKDRRSPGIWFLPGEQKEVAHYIANQTGGEYLEVMPETYAKGLEDILQQLHFRYELGFVPENLDGKRHKLIVKLADLVKNQHKGVRLRYRAGYVPTVPQTR
ncbi:MAG: hypothetical protein ACM34E_06010 [Acidobacteriota bacterium]